MKKKFFIALFVVAAICLFVFAHLVLKSSKPEYVPQENLKAPIEIPNKTIISYEEAIKINKPMLIMFYVDWCGYCIKYMPIFGELAKKYERKYSFVAVNCDKPENLDLVKTFHIVGFPSLFIYDKEINHKFTTHMAATMDNSIMIEELDNYLKVKENIRK